jgi:hypothetical protein
MYKYMQGDRDILGKTVPDYYFAMMAWLIAAQRMGIGAPPAENQGPWFTNKYDEEWGLNGELPLVQMLKDLPSRVRQDGPLAPQWQKTLLSNTLGDDWDSRLNYLGEGIKLEPAADMHTAATSSRWKLVEAKWLNEEEASGASQIFVKALDMNGNPLENARFVVARPGAEDPVVTKGPIDAYWGNYTMYGLLGTYTVRMTEGGHLSDQVSGVGLGSEEVPNGWTNTAFRFTFQLVRAGEDKAEKEEETATEDTTQLPPDEGETEVEPIEPTEPDLTLLHEALLDAVRAHLTARSPRGKFYRYARAHNLGTRRAGDLTFEHSGIRYTAQPFEKGIVYAPVGEWDQVTHIEYAD